MVIILTIKSSGIKLKLVVQAATIDSHGSPNFKLNGGGTGSTAIEVIF